jgi:hypothetical protein
MWKDPNLVLDFKNFWKLPRLFMPYIIPALSDEAVQNYEKGAHTCHFYTAFLKPLS